jgi:hypothetical protein
MDPISLTVMAVFVAATGHIVFAAGAAFVITRTLVEAIIRYHTRR